jgi:hypothetical protein
MRARAERNGYKNGTKYNGLTSQVVYGMLGTPTARHKARSKRFAEGRTMNPQEFANAMLPTPTAQDGGKATKKIRDNHQNNLTAIVFDKMMPTPTASDYKGGGNRKSEKRQMDKLSNAIHPKFGRFGKTSHLNPRFVAEMMGFPVNWTELPFQSGAQNP